MKVLVTGGSGFIGRHFCKLLSESGHELTILDLVKPEFDIGSARFVQGDIRDAAVVRDAIRGNELVLHLAAAHHDFGIEHDTYFSVNEQGAKTLCAAMDEAGVRQLIFFSSVAVYGDTPEPHFEDSPKKPIAPYGASKLAAEVVFGGWTQGGAGRRCLVIRPTVTFGPHNFANMYSLIRQIDSGKFFLVGKGDNVKSLSYVENIIRATMHIWGRSDRPAFDVCNYIDKPDLPSREIASTIYRSLGKKVPSLRVPLGLAVLAALPFDIVIKLTGKNLPVSSARIKKLFATQTKFEADRIAQSGFKPYLPLTEGIDRMVKWYMSEGKSQRAVWRTPPAQVGGSVGYAKMGGKAE